MARQFEASRGPEDGSLPPIKFIIRKTDTKRRTISLKILAVQRARLATESIGEPTAYAKQAGSKPLPIYCGTQS